MGAHRRPRPVRIAAIVSAATALLALVTLTALGTDTDEWQRQPGPCYLHVTRDRHWWGHDGPTHRTRYCPR